MNKVKRIKNGNYTVVSNVFLRDKNLSLKAKGLLTTVMALPDDWDFSIKGISSVLKEGTSAIYSAIDELKENGYCAVVKERDEKGLFTSNDYTFFEEPCMEVLCQKYPHMENREVDNQTQISKEEKETFKVEKKGRKEYSPVFEEAYVAYRRKGSKANAYKMWLKLTDEDMLMVATHIPHYVATREVQYQKDFERYLRDRVFESVVYLKDNIIFDPYAVSSQTEGKETICINGQVYR